MENKTLLRAKNLSVVFDEQKIFEQVSFEVKEEEALAVIGPNGAGKTVLLKALLGIVPLASGTIEWAENLKIGYLPQRFQVDKYLPMTVREFLSLKPEPQSKTKIEEVIKTVALPKTILNSALAHVSSGQMQKILLAWAILDNPKIILFDEPTENIDPVSEESIYHLLHHLQDKLGVAMIIVSHDLNVVYKYANQVLCLNKKMICYGEPMKTLTTQTLGELYGDHAYFHHHHPDHSEYLCHDQS
jgi:zinc transport system ATP-binding protein